MMHKITSHVRAGGAIGRDAWVAKIEGLDDTYGYKRRFLKRDSSGMSKSGRSGCIVFKIDEPGIYEFRGVGADAAHMSISDGFRMRSRGADGFIRVDENGNVFGVDPDTVPDYFFDTRVIPIGGVLFGPMVLDNIDDALAV